MEDSEENTRLIAVVVERVVLSILLYKETHGSRPSLVRLGIRPFCLVIESPHITFDKEDAIYFDGVRVELDERDNWTVDVPSEPAIAPREVSPPPGEVPAAKTQPAPTCSVFDLLPPSSPSPNPLAQHCHPVAPKYPRSWMRLFLELYVYTGRLDRSAEALGVTRANVYHQVEHCPAFAESFAMTRSAIAESLWLECKLRVPLPG